MPFVILLITAFVGLSGAYALGLWWVAGGMGFPLDDAFIHLQFARNLYHSQVMAFNEGIPSSGSSAPGYTLALALAYPLVRDWWWTSYLLGGTASLGIVYGCHRVLFQWTGNQQLARLAALLTLLSYPTIILAYSGMEPPLHVGAFILGLFWYGRGDARGRLQASAAFALGVWFRPEMLLMGPLIVVERALDQPRLTGCVKHRAELLRHAAVWGLAMALYMSFHYNLDGHLVPSTYAAKAQAHSLGRTAPEWFDGLPSAVSHGRWLSALLSLSVWPVAVLLSTLLGILISNGPVMLWGVRRARAAWHEPGSTRAAQRLAALSFVGFPLARGAVQPLGLFLFQFERYFAHLLPVAILFAMALWSRAGALPRGAKRWAFGFAIGGNLLGCAHALMAVDNINAMQVAMGRWLNRHLPPGALVATNDIGAVAFVSERPVLDMMGLVEPKLVSHYLAGGSTLQYIEERAPEVAVVFPSWFPELADSPRWQRVHSISVDPNVICGGPEFVVYERTDRGIHDVALGQR